MNRLWTWVAALVVFLAIGGMGTAILALEQPTGTLTGTVLSQDKRPLAHARVTAWGPVKLTAESDDQGRYRFERIRVGSYQVHASLKGYERQWQSPEVVIAEGKATTGINFALVPMRPAVHFSQYQRVFTPKEPLRISYRGTLVDQVHVALYRSSLPEILRLREGTGNRRPEPAAGDTLVSEWDQTIPAEAGGEDDWFYRHLALKNQPEGLYRIFVQGKGEFNGKPFTTERQATWINVTHVGVVAKTAPDQSLLYAVDLTTNQPLSGVSLAQAYNGSTVPLGTTDRNGLLQRAGVDSRGAIVGRHSGAVAMVTLYGRSSSQRLSGYVYTDRPIYRPAQTVHVKAVLRDRSGRGYSVPAGSRVTLTITDAGGEEVYKRSHTVSRAGSIDDSITLGAQPSLGEYTAVIQQGEATVEQTFQVKAYRKPEFRVEIQPKLRQLIEGDTLEATVNATYYFGAPVAGQNVSYTVYRSRFYPWMDEEDWFFSQYSGGGVEYDWGYGEVVASGDGRTDDAGHLTISVPTAPTATTEPRKPFEATAEYRYMVEVQTTDQTNREVTTRESVMVAPSQVRLQADPVRYVHAPGETISVGLRSRTLDDKPVASKGEAVFYRIIAAERDENGELKGEDTYETVQTVPFSTDSRGVGTISLKAPTDGSYLVAVRSTDDAKRETVATAYVWITADGGDDSSSPYGAMQLIFDKKRYNVGDTATVFIARPRAGVPILLTVEGDRIHQAQVIRGSGPSATVKLPVTATFSPNAFVVATAVDGKAFHNAQRSLNVLPADKFLTVSVTTDRPRYKPGETATVTVQTKDAQGRGVPAEVSVGVVDQAIYALAPDATPDPRMVFHGPRGNEVSTTYSFTEDYSGGADKDAANPRVRKKFLDTAAWVPSLQTDAAGRGVVHVTLPDNLTTWVITARAHTLDTKVGTVRGTFLATQDLLVRLATPRFMVEGDRLTLIGLIHNYLPSAAKLKASLAAIGLAIGGEREASVDVASNGVSKQTFTVSAEQAGQATLTYKAAGSAGGDALEQSFPVLAHGSLDVAVKAGEITDRLEQTIEIPAGAVAGTASFGIELTPTPLGAVAGALEYLRNYPYGCIEQTLNRFVPELVAGPLVDAKPDEQRLREGVERITALQHHDGGWGWWSQDDSQPTLTAYTLLALREARSAGLTVPGKLSKEGTDFLVRGLPNLGFDKVTANLIERGGGPDEQALVLHALAAWGINRPVELAKLERNQTGLTAQGLAHLAQGLALSGDITAARRVIGTLDAQAITSESLAHWEPKDAQPWFNDAIESTSQVVRAMVQVSPDDPRIEQAVRFLLRERRGRHWQSTKDTSATVLALAEVSRRQGEAPASLPVTVKLDGNVLAQTDLAEDSAWRLGYRLDVPPDKLTPGSHNLTIERGDTDGRPLPYSWSRSVMVRADRLEAQKRADLSIQRHYRLLTSAVREAKTGSDFSQWFNPEKSGKLPGATSGLLPGDLVLVELTITATQPRAFAMIEDPLPAGFEVVPDRGEDMPWSYWWTHNEARDDRMAFFMRRLPAGTHTLYYVLRPEIPGRVRALPPVISEMYAPDVRARDGETTLSVGG